VNTASKMYEVEVKDHKISVLYRVYIFFNSEALEHLSNSVLLYDVEEGTGTYERK